MSDSILNIHVLYESSAGGLPHGCSEIRLIRPLSHPSISSEVSLTYGTDLPDIPFDVIIIERLWDHTCDWHYHHSILQRARLQGAKIIYELDDNLLDLNSKAGDTNWPTSSQKLWLMQMARFADGVIVSTPNLAKRLSSLNKNVVVLENFLDEQLFFSPPTLPSQTNHSQVKFGYMGTYTHIDDLISIIHPLRRTLRKHSSKVSFEILGIGDAPTIREMFADLPVKILSVPPSDTPYKNFTSYFKRNINWNFGIAPLIDSDFTKCKSDIKYLDYGVHGIPGIFSDTPAYSATISHLNTGILATDNSSWEYWLESLILDQELRQKLAHNAHTQIWSERMLKTTASRWTEAIRKLVSLSHSSTQSSSIPGQSFTPSQNLSRNEKVLFGCNLRGIGLEIGASYCPVAPKSQGFNVHVLDHADASTLKEKYKNQNVDIRKIEEVDYVWSGQPLHELTEKKDYYDWIIASHVIEHTPDLVSFLQQCEIMLKPGGILCLAIPDHRYCFDIFRPTSTPGEVIQAYVEKRRRHSLSAIWDHFSMITRKGETVAWHKGHSGNFNFIHPSLDDAKRMLAFAQESDEYIDVHNWKFTPSSFKLILHDIQSLNYTSFNIKSFFATEGCEFIVQLCKEDTLNELSNALREEIIKNRLKEALEVELN
ncbi:methyltransferase domain-containing protein [Pseudomonas schmalbachii]|uniref:Methyltransferase domain-containing protein n=1 Tax=Pseudomonas schmalbachii TaxID=2816993 RepID=A0ABS3TSA2_9PSED|nr:methyltransferase domain-containing protein [Pseudomonas schmalbachii]MBO3276233.1 methyltransferase domain-containing protein [Pseudomonas schmalbachii]